MLVLLMACLAQGEIVLEKTGVFNPLTNQTAARLDNGGIFVFDRFEHNIWLFDTAGNKKQVARKGPGPGEIERTNGLTLFEDTLYVFSANHIQSYNAEGQFLKRIKLPPSMIVQKTGSGWIGQKRGMLSANNELKRFNHDLTRPELIVKWQEDRPRMTRIEPGKPREVPVFTEMGNFIVSKDGTLLYYRKPNQSTIQILSTKDKALVGKIELERYVFNESVGQDMIAKMQKKSSSKIKGIFPEFFPYSNGFHWDPRDYFVVAQWQGAQLHLRYFHPDGKPAKNRDLTTKQLERVIGADAGHLFVSFKDPDSEEMGIRKIAERETSAFFKAFPVEE